MRIGKLLSGLDGFLGTYTSRYSQWDGYWLFGFLVDQPLSTPWDLLDTEFDPSGSIVNHARHLAIKKFNEQAKKQVGIAPIGRAELDIQIGEEVIVRDAFGSARIGRRMKFIAVCEHEGRVAQRDRTIHVAPHNSRRELRSASG